MTELTNHPVEANEEKSQEPTATPFPPVYVTLLSDSAGNRPVDIGPLQRNLPGATLTVRNLMGYIGSEPGTTAQVFVNNQLGSLDTPIVENDTVYVAGKLAGGN